MKNHAWLTMAVLACVGLNDARAADFPTDRAITDAGLDRIRGGFGLGGDLRASFALQRTVLINGVQAMQTSISVPDIATITSDQAAALQGALSTTVVTNGAGGVTASAVAPGTGSTPGLIVQNSLDNQAIAATTTIDASVNSAGMLQNMRAAEAIKDAVIQFRGN